MFDYKKYYVFSLDKFIEDMVKIGKSDEDIKSCYELWAGEIDGSIVRYVNEKCGYCDGYLVDFDWCEEIDPYDM